MRGSIRKIGKKYYIRFYVDENGTKRQVERGGFNTKKEAEKALNEQINKVEKGEYFKADVSTLGEYLEYWMQTYAIANVAPSTYERYEYFVKDLKPLHGIGIADLKNYHIQNFYTKLLREGKKSASTVLKIHRFLHLALGHAVKWQMILNNPVDNVEPPKALQKQIKTFNKETLTDFLEFVDNRDHNFYIGVMLAAETGMRRGEVCGLELTDINTKTGILTVNHILEYIKGKVVKKDPKTKKSRRSIVLFDSTRKKIEAWITELKAQKLEYGEGYIVNNYVFRQENGNYYDPQYVTQKFNRYMRAYCKDKDIKPISFHGLRHTHATLLLETGMHPKVVSERLGHSTTGITMDLYSHVTESIQRDAIQKAEGIFG